MLVIVIYLPWGGDGGGGYGGGSTSGSHEYESLMKNNNVMN